MKFSLLLRVCWVAQVADIVKTNQFAVVVISVETLARIAPWRSVSTENGTFVVTNET